MEKKSMTRGGRGEENVAPDCTFFQLGKSRVNHTLVKKSCFSMFQNLILHTALSREREYYLCSVSNAATVLLEPQKHCCIHVCMICFLGFFYFAIKNYSVCLVCFSFSNHCTACRRGRPEFLLEVNSLLFWTSVHWCEI